MFYDIEKRFFLATQYSRLESIALVQRAYRSKYHAKTFTEKVKNLVLEDKTISLRKLSQLVPASQSTVRKVVRDVLKLKSYKKKLSNCSKPTI